MSIGARRLCAWLVGAVCLVAVIALVIIAIFDLQVGDGTSSVIGGITALIGLAISVITLLMNPANVASRSPARLAKIRARGRGTIAAGGDIRGNAIGKRAKVAGPMSPAPSSRGSSTRERDITAKGAGATGAGGDIVDNAIGEDSER